ncbi:MAG TPA: hypothetical protein VGE72_23770, partial [Azospirillum sp.]
SVGFREVAEAAGRIVAAARRGDAAGVGADSVDALAAALERMRQQYAPPDATEPQEAVPQGAVPWQVP